MPKDDIREVLDQISSVKQQSQNVGEYLQYERKNIEEQLCELVEKVRGLQRSIDMIKLLAFRVFLISYIKFINLQKILIIC